MTRTLTMAENRTLSKLYVRARSTLDGSELTPQFMRGLLHKKALGGAQSVVQNVTMRVEYAFDEGQPLLRKGQHVRFLHAGQFECASCHKTVKKLFDAYCFPCFKSKASADICMMSPHKCHYMQGTCREAEWGASVCYQSHYLYLAHTDKYKIGITREGQVPTRWIDQGATAATVLARVSSRHQVGVLEKFLTEILADKSNWQRMLKEGNGRPELAEFAEKRGQVLQHLLNHEAYTSGRLLVPTPPALNVPAEIEIFEESPLFYIEYPLPAEMPAKIVSINLDKMAEIEGTIQGIKGQYLFLDQTVFNVRRHEGYKVEFALNS